MTTKERPRLSLAALDSTATGRPAQEVPMVESEPVADLPSTGGAVRKSRRRVSESEPRGITVWVEPDVFVSLKTIALHDRKSMREIMTEAIADYLRKKKQLSIVKSPPPKA